MSNPKNREEMLVREINKLGKQIDDLREKQHAKALELAKICCPFSVNDIIKVFGNYNKGKWFVDEILCGQYDKTEVRIKATKLKKDGSRSKVTSVFEGWLIQDCKKIGVSNLR